MQGVLEPSGAVQRNRRGQIEPDIAQAKGGHTAVGPGCGQGQGGVAVKAVGTVQAFEGQDGLGRGHRLPLAVSGQEKLGGFGLQAGGHVPEPARGRAAGLQGRLGRNRAGQGQAGFGKELAGLGSGKLQGGRHPAGALTFHRTGQFAAEKLCGVDDGGQVPVVKGQFQDGVSGLQAAPGDVVQAQPTACLGHWGACGSRPGGRRRRGQMIEVQAVNGQIKGQTGGQECAVAELAAKDGLGDLGFKTGDGPSAGGGGQPGDLPLGLGRQARRQGRAGQPQRLGCRARVGTG